MRLFHQSAFFPPKRWVSMAALEQSDVHVTVFGGLKLLRPSIDLAPRPPRERLILARLVAAQGTPVSASELVDALWPDDPPTTAVNQIQRHIGELRRLLEPMLPPRASFHGSSARDGTD
jgi:DNA-binding SARP family transcriptional activator